MTAGRYLLRSLWFYRRENLGILLGAALAATVLAGALMVGDSVRYSLEQLTLSRLGGTDYVIVSGEHFFHADLAERMASETTRQSAVLILDGVALAPEGDRRINNVQVIGVDASFWALAPAPVAAHRFTPGTVLVNQPFAERLGGAGPDDAFILRIRPPGGLPVDMTLATRESDAWSRRLRIAGLLEPAAFGRFSLRATQMDQPTVFLPREWLSSQLGLDGRANTLLIQVSDSAETVNSLQQRLDTNWRLGDAGLRVEALADGTVTLQSDRVFIPPPVAAAAHRIERNVQPVITYFANRIASGDRETPYSFVTAPGPPRVPDTVAEHEVLINDWLADDLGAAVGDSLTISYYAIDSGSRLEERSETFAITAILPVRDIAGFDRHLVPAIPGLSDADHCRDWDPGIPIALDRIRAKDEAYWDAYGPLPKLYLAQAAAERLWSNRFGRYTALRFPPSAGSADDVSRQLRTALGTRDLGFRLQAAKADGLTASRESVDFGQLFIGLSFFLIAAAMLLTALLFAFSIQYRAAESGTLRALGFRPRAVARLQLAEGLLLVSAGTCVGGVLAAGYNALVLRALQTLWHDAVRTAAFQSHIRPASALLAILIVIGAAAASMGLALRSQMRATIRELQQREQDATAGRPAGRLGTLAGIAGTLLAGAVLVTVPAGQDQAAMGVFFGTGSLLLLSLLLLCHGALSALRRRPSDGTQGRAGLILRSAALRTGRSLTCITLLALGVFLVVAVAANRRGPVRNPEDPAAGTGGYRIWGQTTLPVVHDLNTARGRVAYGLSPETAAEAVFTQLRLLQGDDASCLNLNRVALPGILGVDPEAFDRRGAFTFTRLADGVDPEHPWRALQMDLGDDVIPVVADQADIVWGLGKSIGDTLTYQDEAGRSFQVTLMAGLAGSILQGHLIMDQQRMTDRFPSLGGTHILLVEAPEASRQRIQRELTVQLAELGLACVTTRQRLAAFNSVENTYLAIFMLLGGLGLLTGSAGMGIVAARTIVERRAELALLRAVGFRRRQLQGLVFAEHGVLAVAGILIGTSAALAAVTPAILTPGAAFPWRGVSLTLAAILAGSLLWIGAAVHIVLRGPLTGILQNE